VSVASLRNMSSERKCHAITSILQGESLTRLLQGAAAGAVATMFVGFYGVDGRSAVPLTRWQKNGQTWRSSRRWHLCALTNSAHCLTPTRRKSRFEGRFVEAPGRIPKEIVTLPGESYPSSAL